MREHMNFGYAWHRWLRSLSLLLSLFALASADALADTINWGIYDIPPVFILHDRNDTSLSGDGAADRMLSMLIQAMPDDHHNVKVYPISRMLVEMAAGDPLCVFPLQRTPERDKFAQSVLVYHAPAPNLVFNTKVFALHPEWRNGARLRDVEADPRITGQYLASRSFGDRLNNLIHDQGNENLKPNAGSSTVSQLQMVAVGRVDYTIENGSVMVYLMRQKTLPNTLAAVPILDAEDHIDAYAMCTRGSWGEAVLRKIDVAAKKVAAKPEFADAMYHWQSEQELKKNKKNYDKFYHLRATTLFCRPDCP